MRHLSFCLLTVAAVLPAVCVCADNPGERRSVPWEKTCMMDNPDVKMSFYNSDYVQYFYDELISNGYWEDSDIEAPDGSRHKIITEQGLDVTTSVPVLPEGESVSVRLGTRGYAGDEAAKGGGVKFQYEVTEDNAILFASYSALVEDPWNDHLAELQKLVGQTVTYGGESYTIGDYSTITNFRWTFEQPVITFYIEKDGSRKWCSERSIYSYDEYGYPTKYGAVISADNYGHPAYYNPWTVMAVDLSPYIGQTISFGAEYHDCAEAGLLYLQKDGSTYYDSPIIRTCQDRHISRLYLHPSYGPARIQQTGEDCQTRTYTFSAPEGFIIITVR